MTRFQIVITVIVTAVWTAAYAKNIARGASPPQEITVPFLIVLGWVSGARIRRPREGDEPDLWNRLYEAFRPRKDQDDDRSPT